MERSVTVVQTATVRDEPRADHVIDGPGAPNPRKVRAGLAIICVVVVIAVGGLFVIPSAVGKAVMLAVAVSAFVRAALLVRALRRGAR